MACFSFVIMEDLEYIKNIMPFLRKCLVIADVLACDVLYQYEIHVYADCRILKTGCNLCYILVPKLGKPTKLLHGLLADLNYQTRPNNA